MHRLQSSPAPASPAPAQEPPSPLPTGTPSPTALASSYLLLLRCDIPSHAKKKGSLVAALLPKFILTWPRFSEQPAETVEKPANWRTDYHLTNTPPEASL